jgi:hypothetical protein
MSTAKRGAAPPVVACARLTFADNTTNYIKDSSVILGRIHFGMPPFFVAVAATDRSVANQHAKLHWLRARARWAITALSEANMIVINDANVPAGETRELDALSRIKLGATTFYFSLPAAPSKDASTFTVAPTATAAATSAAAAADTDG